MIGRKKFFVLEASYHPTENLRTNLKCPLPVSVLAISFYCYFFFQIVESILLLMNREYSLIYNETCDVLCQNKRAFAETLYIWCLRQYFNFQ